MLSMVYLWKTAMMKLAIWILTIICTVTCAAQGDSVRLFAFGHSLIDHALADPPTPSNETVILHWMSIIADHANNHLAAGGKYGFLPTHANNLPPFAQWGYDTVQAVWDSDNESFAEAEISDIMITAANFIQWQPPTMPYYGPDSIYTPITATTTVFDWVDAQQSSEMHYYIYENWPDLGPYLANGTPPSATEWATYHDFSLGEFHDWWITYQDSLLLRRPALMPRMIPVGPILSELLTGDWLENIPFDDLYQDSAPHGRPSIYFLAGLISYMAIYAEPAPSDLPLDPIIHQDIRDHYIDIVNYIWAYLLDFNDPEGDSRVFFDDNSPVHISVSAIDITLYPNPTSGYLYLDGTTHDYQIDVIDSLGHVHSNHNGSGLIEINISTLPTGVFYLRLVNNTNGQLHIEKILKQ